MSVLNKTPFIQELLASLSGDEKSALLNCVNGNTTVAKYSLNLRNLSVSTPIESICLETNTHVYNGYKIYKNNKITFLMYNIGQDINMYQVSYPYYEKELKGRVKEPLTIDELRRYLETDGGVGESVSIDEIDSGDATAGKVIKADGEGGAVWSDDNGLPPSTKANQVLVSDDEGGWDEKKSVPLADNLLATPVNNDALYSAGPTGGLADISTGEEAYLQEVKGMSIVWNQLIPDSGSGTIYYNSSHIYILATKSVHMWTLIQSSSSFLSYNNGNYELFDLTLMFGSNGKIPFSLTEETEYAANGTIPAQTVTAVERFQRLFANVDLWNAPYDAGTIKNVSATTLVETGQNLWDASTMNTTGLHLLPGYRYEIYLSGGTSNSIQVKIDGGSDWDNTSLTRYQRADGKYIFMISGSTKVYKNGITIRSNPNVNPITYVGFVHSGNYCLTTGTLNYSGRAITDVTIPAYSKHEYSVGLSGLNGLTNSDGEIVVYDTKNYTRVGSMDLSQYQSVMTYDEDNSSWVILTEDLPQNCGLCEVLEGGIGTAEAQIYLNSNGYFIDNRYDDNGIIGILITNDSDSVKPTGILLYPLLEPVATGQDAFEPIAIDVNDMGLEYFIQPANANCPVNQVSYYYENLKDKLANLQIPEIEVIPTNYTVPTLTGLNINGNKYKLLPADFDASAIRIGTFGSYSSASGEYLAIGNNLGNAISGAIIIGNRSGGTSGGVALGASAWANGGIAIGNSASVGHYSESALGFGSINLIQDSVSFDGVSSSSNLSQGGQRTLQMFSPQKLFFRNANVDNSKTTFASYIQGHYLSEYIQLNDLMSITDIDGPDETVTGGTWDTSARPTLTSTKVFNGTEINGVEIVVVLLGQTSGDYQISGILDTKENGDLTLSFHDFDSEIHIEVYVNLDSSGHIALDLTNVTGGGTNSATSVKVKYHLL